MSSQLSVRRANLSHFLCNEETTHNNSQVSSTTMPDEQTKTSLNPMLIDCVIEHCFKYLSVKTISQCRLVSRYWNTIASRTLRLRSYVKFKFAEEIYGYMKLMESCNDIPFRKYVFHIFDHELNHNLVQTFCEKYGDNFLSITFDLTANSSSSNRYTVPVNPLSFKRLLVSSEHQLDELRLYGLPETLLNTPNLFPMQSSSSTSTPFINLKTFAISVSQDIIWKSKHQQDRSNVSEENDDENEDEEEEEESNAPTNNVQSGRALVFNIIQLARNLTTLEVGSLSCLPELCQTGCLRKLEKFSSIPGKSPGLTGEECYNLGQHCPNLKHLNIFVDPNHTSTLHLYEMLSKLTNLTYLCIRGGPSDVDKFGINFPLMSNLTHISIYQASLPLDQLIASLPKVKNARISIHPVDCQITNNNNNSSTSNNNKAVSSNNTSGSNNNNGHPFAREAQSQQLQLHNHRQLHHHNHHHNYNNYEEPMDYSVSGNNNNNNNNNCDENLVSMDEEEEEEEDGQVDDEMDSSSSPMKRQLISLYTSHDHDRDAERMLNVVPNDDSHNNGSGNNSSSFANFLVNIKLKFPLISRLRINVDTNEEMQQIYSLHHLSDLHIEDGSDISDKDITGILYSDLFKWYEGRNCRSRSEADIRNSRTGRYIGDLKRLKRLYLGTVKITNASIIFGMVDNNEMTSLSIKEPQYRITESGESQAIRNHSFCLEILASRLRKLVRIQVTETQSRKESDHSRPTAVTLEEIQNMKRIQPHLQLVYITFPDELGKVKVLNY